MKSSAQRTPRRTPRPAIHGGGWTKETPPNPSKVVPRRLSFPFSAVLEETPTEFGDLFDFSPESSSNVEDPTEIPPPLLIESKDEGSQVSSEIIVTTVDEQEIRPEEELVDRLRKALRELMESTEVNGRSEMLLSALLEAIEDARSEGDAKWDSEFWMKVRIGIVCYLILLVAAINLLVVWGAAIVDGGERRDFSGLPPPT